MAIKLVREFQHKQQLSITPQLRKSIDLLQLSRLEIINKINREIEDNPFIVKKPEQLISAGYDDARLIESLSEPQSLQSSLNSQLEDLRLSQSEKKISSVIIQSLEENGLMLSDMNEMEEMMSYQFSSQEIKVVLEDIVQNLDPAGIGARNFKELVFLQLKRKKLSAKEIALSKKILFNPKYSNFEDAKTELIKTSSAPEIEKILHLIKNCDLSPGLDFQNVQFIQPDLEILPIDDNLTVKFIEANFPILSLDKNLAKLVKDKNNDANSQLKEKVNDAKWLMRAIEKRNETVQTVGALICERQSDFLLNRSAELKPLSNLELARDLKLSPSTISRILRAKYIQTPKGAVSMRSLLVSSVSKTRGVTPTQLMEEIQEIVTQEVTKLSDQKISDMLNKRGFNLARRTITKYRKKINIPSSRKR
jgi:RNA polymerase sigma-54 factor|tara:strand:+ start:491 stop:1753 length:1263 start_codon:yes stop_codon:yes gene_type:complete